MVYEIFVLKRNEKIASFQKTFNTQKNSQISSGKTSCKFNI